MKISKVAKLSGVTIRTLHYYDEIGLLCPSVITEAGYREYKEKDLLLLQQILFFKELDFSLHQIKEIMNNPTYNVVEALTRQQGLLIKKQQRLNGIIDLISLKLKGESKMSFKEFSMEEIEAEKKKYAEEVKIKWGSTDVYVEYEKKTDKYDNKKWRKVKNESEELLKEFSLFRNESADSEEVQALVIKWQRYITDNFYDCSNEILAGLGVMYLADSRFKSNMDKYGEGTTDLIAKAIEIFCAK